jgi:pimeloyl-ACP methyl ester carboxylesterase/predicted glycosyltransferase
MARAAGGDRVRARLPDRHGFADSDGAAIAWEEHGTGEHALLLMPPWQIVHSGCWKAQVPYLSRYFRVLVYDARGSGRSARPATGFDHDSATRDALAVLDATGTPRASLLAFSRGSWPAVLLAGQHPERVDRMVLVSSALASGPRVPNFRGVLPRYEGWERFNANYWTEHLREFAEFFIGEFYPEPHSTKQWDDAVGWAMENTPDVLAATIDEASSATPLEEALAKVRAPTLLVHGTDDRVRSISVSERAHAAIAGSRLVRFEGSGHAPLTRDPVRFNVLVRDFLLGEPPARDWARPRGRKRRALFISSPIGLGHALRDVAVVEALRASRPDLEVHWLAQDPVTRVLEARGERVHPASRLLAGESAHFEAESGEHDLHCFQAWRDMDEILVANFMVLHDVLEAEPYDLVVGDEAWDVDYYLHENPELKRTAFAWMTDFVGWLPMDARPGSREAVLTADYNAEMIEQIARFPRVRDRALFVGQPDDIVEADFGPGLPRIRDWTREHFQFPGYILPFDPGDLADRAALRRRLGLPLDERIVLAAVGGTAVGVHLLRKVVAAAPLLHTLVRPLRLIVVCGPRLDPAALPQIPGVEYRRFVPDLAAHMAAADLSIVQGGLATTMELTAVKRPFIYVPLRRHFEQNLHVPHRLARYGAGIRMDYEALIPEALAHAAAGAIDKPVDYRDVEPGGAQRAAAAIAELL